MVYLNQKQDSREGIKAFRTREKSLDLKNEFSEITRKVKRCDDLNEFSELMLLHESMLSSFLNVKTVKQKFFEEAPVFVKSLGAWGGDFALSAKFGDYKNYFMEKGFSKILNYNDLVY